MMCTPITALLIRIYLHFHSSCSAALVLSQQQVPVRVCMFGQSDNCFQIHHLVEKLALGIDQMV